MWLIRKEGTAHKANRQHLIEQASKAPIFVDVIDRPNIIMTSLGYSY
jgi:hypothetical protein